MAEFRTTTGCIAELESIIRTSKKTLFLVSPYLRLDNNFYERIKDADDKKIQISLLFGKEELLATVREFFKGLDNVSVYYHKDLHAKCYYNEKMMLLTSMNLYVSSSRDKNREMGVLINKHRDKKLYADTISEVESIINSSKLILERQKKVDQPLKITKSKEKNEVKLEVYQALKKDFPDLEIGWENARIKIDFSNSYSAYIEHRYRVPFSERKQYEKLELAKAIRRLDLDCRVYSSEGYSLNVYKPSWMTNEEEGELKSRIVEMYLSLVKCTVDFFEKK